MKIPRIATSRKRRYPVTDRPVPLLLIIADAFGLGFVIGLLTGGRL